MVFNRRDMLMAGASTAAAFVGYSEDRDAGGLDMHCRGDQGGSQNRTANAATGRTADPRSGTWTQENRDGYYARIPDRDKAVVAFSTDDGAEEDYTHILPEFRDRGLPWASSIPAARVNSGGSVSHAQVDEMVAYGTEVVAHGKHHRNLYEDLETTEERREEIREARTILEEYNWQVNGFLPRGRDGVNGPFGEVEPPQYDTDVARLIRANYAWSIGRNNNPLNATNFNKLHGDNKNYLLDDGDAAGVIELVDKAIATNGAIEFAFHPYRWDSSDVDALRRVLDHCEAEREKGNLVVASPTTLRRHSRTPDAVNMAPDPSAEAWESFDRGLWDAFHNEPVVKTDGGRTGQHYWAIGARFGGDSYGGLHLYHFPVNVEYPALMIECAAKGAAGNESVTMGVRGHEFADRVEREFSLSTEWQSLYAPVGIPRGGTFLRPMIWTGDDEVHVDDIAIYPC